MAKANKDGWVRHRGGKCPVEAGTLLDVRYRDGVVHKSVTAIYSSDCDQENWIHEEDKNSDLADCDIMAYRIHKPEIEQSVVEIAVDGPLQWRNRIRQIDAEEEFRNLKHRTAIESLEEERLSLVQKLEAEGFKLIDAKTACDGMPDEDMSDYRNWKVGDKIEFIGGGPYPDAAFKVGNLYVLRSVREDRCNPIEIYQDEHGDQNAWRAEYFKWHSRP